MNPTKLCLVTLTILAVAFATPVSAGTLAKLTIQPEKGEKIEASCILSWEAEPGVLYRVQRSSDLGNWIFCDAVSTDGTNASVQIKGRSIPENSVEFFRLEAHPEIFSVEPTFVDSSDTNAVLYILGQLLPTNATIVINGQNFTPTILNSNGVWATVRLNGLPPGEPVIGTLTVIDNGTSNVVATLPVQSPIIYGTTPTTEQLQGPAEEPPASPMRQKITKSRSNIQNNRMGLLDSIRENDNVVFEVQEGKKGLNAVNVKLARMAGGGDCDDGDDGSFPWAHLIAPAALKVKEKGNRTKCTSNLREINPATGELCCEETDFAIFGRDLDFVWTRTYGSRTGPDTALGHGWDFSYNVSLTQQPNGTLVLRPGNGRADTFYPNGTNGWSRDEYFVEIRDLNSDGMPDVLFADTGKWLFNPAAAGPASGKLWKIVDRNGNTVTLAYDTSGRLASVVDDLGRTNAVAYNSFGQLVSVTDFSGRVVRYEYDTKGDLIACVSPAVTGTPNGNDFPGGKTNRYTYTSGFPVSLDRLNHNLTSCTDAKGQTWLQVVYQDASNPASLDFDAVAYTLRGIDKKDIWRGRVTPSPANGFATVQVIVRDAVGNVTECFYDSRLRCVCAREYTGRSSIDFPVTDTSNRPKNKLRLDDPDFFETLYRWNPDSLCKMMTVNDRSVARQQYFFAHESDLVSNPSPRKKGDLRVLRQRSDDEGVDLDGDGVADTTERAWHFEYDPRFGSPRIRNWVKDCYDGKENLTRSAMRDGRPMHFSFTLWENGNRSGAKMATDGGFEKNTENVSGGFGLSGGGPNGQGLRVSSNGTIKSSVESAKIITDRDSGRSKGFGFATSETDPNGNRTTATYDVSGNCLETRAEYYLDPQNKPRQTMVYNSYGQCVAITNAPDGLGYRSVDTVSYYTNGPSKGLPEVMVGAALAGALALTTAFAYDPHGNVTNVVDPRGNDWRFSWNARDQLVRAETPTNINNRCVTHYFYDANDNIVQSSTELRDENDVFRRAIVPKHVFDTLDRRTESSWQISPGVYVTNKYFYNGNDQVVAIHSPLAVSGADPGNLVAFEYDERGGLFRAIAAPGSGAPLTNEWSYDYRGTTHNFYVGPNYDRRFAYDGFGRPVNVTDGMSNVVTYAYDRNDNLIRAQVFGEVNDTPGSAGNVRLSESRWQYDGRNQCVKKTASLFDPVTQLPLGDGASVSTFAYAPNGQLMSETDDNGHTTSYAYDAVGRLAQTTDAKFNLLQFSYDTGGNLLTLTSIERSDVPGAPQQFTRSCVYDALNRCTYTVDNTGNTNRVFYDSLGRSTRSTDANGHVSFSLYDDLSRLTVFGQDLDGNGGLDRAIDPDSSYVYDDNSRIVSSTDDNTNTTLYAYDSFNRLVVTTNADGTTHKLIWSPRSNVVREEDANGTIRTNIYDALDRLVRRDIALSSTVAATTTFEGYGYDGLSRLVAATNDNSHVEFGYDSLSRNTRDTSGGVGALTTTRVYDGVGNCLSETYPSGRVVTYAYNVHDEVSSISTPLQDGAPPSVVATFGYDGPDRLATITRANGVGTRLNWNGMVNPANAAGDFGSRQVRRVNHQKSGNGSVIDQRVASFDRNQNRVLRMQTAAFYPGGNTRTNGMEYDALNRVTVVWTVKPTEVVDVYEFTLDGVGNRQVVTSNGVGGVYTMDNTPLPGPADFQMNQYTLTPFAAQTFDAKGNMTSQSSSASHRVFQYDFDDRLVSVTDFSTGAAVPVASYSYDALGRRISKTTYPPSPLAPVTTEFIYGEEGARILQTRRDGAFVDSYIHKLDDGLTVYRASSAGTSVYYHSDDLGNVLALTDAAGNVVERYDYDAFGQPQILTSDGFPMATSASTVGNPFLFHGMEWDDETGFYVWKEFSPAEEQLKGNPRHRTRPVDPKTAQGVCARVVVKIVQELVLTRNAFEEHNPWSGGGGGSEAAAKVSRPVLKSFFQSGDKPTQAQFATMLDSMVNFVDDRDFIGLREYNNCQPCPTGGWCPGGGRVWPQPGYFSGKVPRVILKEFFQTGDKPTQLQSSYNTWHYQRPRYRTGNN